MRHKLDPVLDIFPKWRTFVRLESADDGSTFEVLEVSWWSGKDWCGSAPLDAGQRIRVRSWRGALNADIRLTSVGY